MLASTAALPLGEQWAYEVKWDGELVALVDGRPDFGTLQPRMHVRSPSAALVRSTPVTFIPFDVLHLEDTPLLDSTYDERRAVLEGLGLDAPPPFYGDGLVLALVCGWKESEGGRSGRLGSLLLGIRTDRGLGYAGHVGTGFTDATLRQLGELLVPLARNDSPYDEDVPTEHARAVHWVEPVLVVDVDYAAWTKAGRLRHPSYQGIRTDLDPQGVVRE